MGRTLYHFTRPANVESIKEYGIVRGDVPTSYTGGFNAPWLTEDPTPTIQNWVKGTDKDKVRITVNVKRDKWLRKWSTFAVTFGVTPEWLEILDRTGGGGSDNWYIHLGPIPASWITNIEYL